ncbi:hypothetical protein OH492_05925 [Vibrio chagasii]|nr:hypothetical protein [Vibrio chagasii]
MKISLIVPKAYIDTIYNGANNHTAIAVAPVAAVPVAAVAAGYFASLTSTRDGELLVW